jgi:hypothetical protein
MPYEGQENEVKTAWLDRLAGLGVPAHTAVQVFDWNGNINLPCCRGSPAKICCTGASI